MKNTNDKATEVKDIVFKDILMCCSGNIRNILNRISDNDYQSLQEIRIRINRPLMFTLSYGDVLLNDCGEMSKELINPYIININDIHQTLELMSDNSLFAYQEELKNGFLTLQGGHRVGIVGKVVAQNNEIKTLKDICGLNIRIARQVKDCANRILPYIIDGSSIYHTLILSPPNCGKTTLLRDAIRQISNGIDRTNFCGVKVGLVDERSEIAACFKGIPQNDIGIRTDVFDSCPKPQGIRMLTRSMSPQVIATDELGTKDDIDAVEEAINAGIKIITTAHAKDTLELSKKPWIGQLFKQGFFERIIILGRTFGVGTVEEIVDGNTLSSIWRVGNAS